MSEMVCWRCLRAARMGYLSLGGREVPLSELPSWSGAELTDSEPDLRGEPRARKVQVEARVNLGAAGALCIGHALAQI